MTLTDRQSTGLRKGLLRAPIWLCRMHLGAVVGHRLAYLASGTAQRPTRRGDAGSRQIHPASGGDSRRCRLGRTCGLDRNLRVAPPIQIVSGSSRWADPDQRFVDAAETSALHMNYQQAHPRAWRRLARTVGLPIVPDDQDWTAVASRVPAVAFTPQQLIR